jgi:hypothetical protein
MKRAFPEFADTIFVLWHMTFGKHEVCSNITAAAATWCSSFKMKHLSISDFKRKVQAFDV